VISLLGGLALTIGGGLMARDMGGGHCGGCGGMPAVSLSLIGIGSVVIDNVATGPGVLLAAGSVLTRDTGAGDKLFGVPARGVPTLRRFGPTPRTEKK